jgi:hypothetical protein
VPPQLTHLLCDKHGQLPADLSAVSASAAAAAAVGAQPRAAALPQHLRAVSQHLLELVQVSEWVCARGTEGRVWGCWAGLVVV